MLPKSTEARNLFSSTEQVVAKAGTKDAHNKGQETWLEREAGVREQHLKPMGGKWVSEGNTEDGWKGGELGSEEASWEAIQEKSDEDLMEVVGTVKRPTIIATRQHGDPPGMNNLDMHHLHVKDVHIFHITWL